MGTASGEGYAERPQYLIPIQLGSLCSHEAGQEVEGADGEPQETLTAQWGAGLGSCAQTPKGFPLGESWKLHQHSQHTSQDPEHLGIFLFLF